LLPDTVEGSLADTDRKWNFTAVSSTDGESISSISLVTEHVSQPYLGIDWLTDHNANWNFRKKELTVNGV